MARFVNPFTDVGFKLIFGQEISKDLLIDFLNQLLKGERHIVDLTFLDKEQLPMFINDRAAIYDIYCKTETGEYIIVEMQNQMQASFGQRAIYYMSQAIVRQGERGSAWNYDVKAVYGVFFMNFMLKGMDAKLRTDVALMDMDTKAVFSDKVRLVFLQLPLFKKNADECDNDFERWIYVLNNMENLNRMPFGTKNAVFQKLEELGDLRKLTYEERMKYDESIKQYRDYLAVQEYIRQEREEAIAQSAAESMAKGMAQGVAQGMAKGSEKTTRDIAKKMLSEGFSLDVVERLTGLTMAQLSEL